MTQFWIANSVTTRADFLEYAKKLMAENPYVMWEWVYGKPRTGKQNNSLWLFCRLLAEELNKHGITFQEFFKEGYQVPWSKDIVKENIWNPMQRAVAGETSSADLTTIEVQQIYEHINSKAADAGIHVPWPVRDK